MNSYPSYISRILFLSLISIFLVPVGTSAAAPTTGLIDYWAFDAGSGTTAVDSSGGNNTGTLTNGPAWIAGKVGPGSLSFDGTDSVVKLASDPIGTGTVTVCAWMNTKTLSSWKHVVSNNRFMFGPYSSGNRIVLSSNGSGTIFSATNSITLNTWYHVCAVRPSSGNSSIYINGVQSGTSGNAGTPQSGTGLGIGDRKSSTHRPFNGFIDEVRIYNRVLSGTEIQSVYTDGIDTTAPSAPTGLVATPISTSQINLTWTASTDAVGVTGYKIFRGGVQIATSATNSYPNTGLSISTLYSYAVSSYDLANNNSAQSASVSTTTLATSETISPTPGNSGAITATNIGSNDLTLNWTKATDNVSTQATLAYQVYRSSSNNISTVANAETNGTVVTGCSFTLDVNSCNVTGLNPSTTYYFNIIVRDQAGNKAVYTMQSQTTAVGQTCSSNLVLTDFGSGVSGNPITAATMDASTYGISGANWSVINASTLLTFSPSAHHSLGGTIPTLCTKPWPGDTSSLGQNLFVNSTTIRYGKFHLPAGVGTNVTAGYWFRTDYPVSGVFNIDSFAIRGDGVDSGNQNYLSVSFKSNSSVMELGMETAGPGPCYGHGSSEDAITILPNTWYWVTVRYTSDTSGASRMSLQVYDSNFALVGAIPDNTNTMSCTNERATDIYIGEFSPSGNTGFNHNINYDSLLFCYSGNCQYPLMPTVVTDTTSPVISSVASSGVTETGATVSWTTDESSDTQIDYGLTTAYGSQTVLDSSLTTSHFQSLSGLSAGTVYNYQVRSKDAANNIAISANNTFTTIFDAIPPVISNGGPTGTLPYGTTQTNLSVTTNENATCKYSTIADSAYLDMANSFTTTGAISHSTSISGLVDGNSYTYFVRCQDASNNSNTADYLTNFSVAIFVPDTTDPAVSMTVPINNATVSGTTVAVTATASDNIGVVGAQFKLDGVNLSAEDTVNPYSLIWNTTTASNTPHTLDVVARDAAGNRATSTISVIVSNTTPAAGLVGHWAFDAGSGTTAIDSSISNNTGTLTNGPAWVAGKVGTGALSFNGTNSVVKLASDPVGTGTVTVCAWIKPASLSTWQHLVSNDRFMFGPYSSGNRLILSSDGSGAIFSANNSITLNTWYHICAIRPNSGNSSIYINGVQSGTSGNSGTPQVGSGLGIGDRKFSTANPFNGSIDEVRIYNRALTVTEIQALGQ